MKGRGRVRAVLLAGAAWAWLAAGLALGRPGGGQHFSSGHAAPPSGYGGGYGGGYGNGFGDGGVLDLFQLLFLLLFRVPLIGIPLLLGLGFLIWRWPRNLEPRGGWSTAAPNGQAYDRSMAVPLPRDLAAKAAGQPELLPPRKAIARLRETDPAFSLVLFEDWVSFLYAQVQAARGSHSLATLAPYLTAQVRAQLESGSAGLTSVDEVIVGGLRLSRVAGLSPGSDTVEVQCRLETNFTERSLDTRRTVWSVEVWTLSRKRSAKSRPPAKVELLRCPNCGAPLEGIRGGLCGYCHQQVDRGDFDWQVTARAVVEEVDRLPGAPVGGGDGDAWIPRPTLRDPDAAAGLQALLERDHQLTWEGFLARTGLVFQELQIAWSSLEWSRARPFVTDSLYRSHTYWIDRYRSIGLRNITERAAIERVELCAIDSDAVYDALTVRVFASGLDFTLDADGRVVEGSRSRPQRYSEYWTLVRGRTVQRAPVAHKTCPSCGAPLRISQAGICAYCRAHITSGDFDWVLSRIEQESAYG